MIGGNEAAEIRRRMDAMERRLQAVPSRWGAPANLLDEAVILGGNTLYTGSPSNVYGVQGVAPITSLGSAPPAYVDETTASGTAGVGYARRLRDGAIVLVINDANGQALIGSPYGSESLVYLRTARTLTAGAGAATVWTVV